MANKFQKSVLERKKIEAELRLKEQPHIEQAHEQTEQPEIMQVKQEITAQPIAEEIITTEVIETAEKEEPQTEVKEKKQAKVNENKINTVDKDDDIDLSAFLIPQNLRKAKNKSFYLDDDVISAIKIQSTKRKITESKLVNDILKSVLGV